MIEQVETLFGRSKEIEIIKTYISSRKRLHIHGEEGVGKSFLIEWLCKNWTQVDENLPPIYC